MVCCFEQEKTAIKTRKTFNILLSGRVCFSKAVAAAPNTDAGKRGLDSGKKELRMVSISFTGWSNDAAKEERIKEKYTTKHRQIKRESFSLRFSSSFFLFRPVVLLFRSLSLSDMSVCFFFFK